jgi:hypothetical protein
VPYEEIDPLEGGPRTLVEHSDERCRFHQFLTPDVPSPNVPGQEPRNRMARFRSQRWVREDN